MYLSDIPWYQLGSYSHFPYREYSSPRFHRSTGSPAVLLAPRPPQFSNYLSRTDPELAVMEPLSPDEMERFQKLSNEYEPDIQVSRSKSQA